MVSVAGTGCRRSPAAGRSRRAGTVRPARRPGPAPAPGPMRRAITCGRRRPRTPGPARPAAGGAPPACRRAPRGIQVPGPPGPGWPVGGRRLTTGGQLPAPRCASRPAHCRSQLTSSDNWPAICRGRRVRRPPRSPDLRGGPARRPQLTQRRVQLIEAGTGHELVHPGGREPGRRGQLTNRHALGAGRDQRPPPFPSGPLQPPRGTGDPCQDSPLPPARLDPPADRHPPIVPAAFRKLDAVAVLAGPLLPAPQEFLRRIVTGLNSRTPAGPRRRGRVPAPCRRRVDPEAARLVAAPAPAGDREHRASGHAGVLHRAGHSSPGDTRTAGCGPT